MIKNLMAAIIAAFFLVGCGAPEQFRAERIKIKMLKYQESNDSKDKEQKVISIEDKIKFKGEAKHTIRLKGVSLGTFIEMAFGKVLEVPYVYDASLNNMTDSLDLECNRKITKKAFYRIVDESLDKIGIEVSEKDGVYFCFKKKTTGSAPQWAGNAQTGLGQGVTAGNSLGAPGGISEQRKVCQVIGVRYSKASELSDTIQKVTKGLYDGVQVVEDDQRKLIVVTGEDDKVRKIKKLIHALDIKQSQIMIEAQIIELTLTGDFKQGIQWLLSPEFLGITASTQLSLNKQASLKTGQGGAFSLINDSGRFQFLIQSMISEGVVKVLANPSILSRDGVESNIQIGTEVPIITQEQQTDLTAGGILRNIAYRKTGILLKITPTIISEGIVLKINQESSSASSNTVSDISSPAILNRSISADVFAKDGQSIIIGGIIQETLTDELISVPGIAKVPIIGEAFKFQGKNKLKTELVMIVTPKIIRSIDDWDKIIDSWETNLKGFEIRG